MEVTALAVFSVRYKHLPCFSRLTRGVHARGAYHLRGLHCYAGGDMAL